MVYQVPWVLIGMNTVLLVTKFNTNLFCLDPKPDSEIINLICWKWISLHSLNCVQQTSPDDFEILEIQICLFRAKDFGPDSCWSLTSANWYQIYYPNPDTFHIWQQFIKTDTVPFLT